MPRYICIHGHFYQPPRENPWLEAIEVQDSAYPYHDWNERITAQCYAPNASSRLLDGEGLIVGITNNYAKISFNFGPTLLTWLEEKDPETYRAILDADKESQARFSGHGSALAQAYNHMILPLANRRDKYTQVLWGIRDFEHRFGRFPEGMWLPETAVDLETLEVLADLGMRFTILSPHQAGQVRKLGEDAWHDVRGGRVDPSRPYLQRLPSGKEIVLYFYDGPIAQAVAFEGLLSQGERLANRLLGAFPEQGEEAQLVHIASDGETYGHHHRFGDMALAYALHYIESRNLAWFTNYGEYLALYPPTYEVEVIAATSWSCVHGVERWKSDCGCNTGEHPEWNQRWRGPLRAALDWLRDNVAPLYEAHAGRLFSDPWAARNDYISVLPDHSDESLKHFLRRHATHGLNEEETVTAIKLLELQRHAMLMYTSCGWYFNDLSGIETVQIIQYAGRALQLAEELFGDQQEEHFLELLQQAKSNLPTIGNGRTIYQRFVKPAQVSLERAVAHYAVSSLFEDYPQETDIYCYTFLRDELRRMDAGQAKLLVGRTTVRSRITLEKATLSFGILHLGDHNMSGGVREFQGDQAFAAVAQELEEAFSRADFADVIRLLDRHFGDATYSVRSLFRDEQRKAVKIITTSIVEEAQAGYRQVYDHHAPLLRFLSDIGAPIPQALRTAAELVINEDFRRALEEEELDAERLQALYEDATSRGIELDIKGIKYALSQAITRLAAAFAKDPLTLARLQGLEAMVTLAGFFPPQQDLWKAQNVYYRVLTTVYLLERTKSERGNKEAQAWVDTFRSLGEKLRVRLD